MKVPELGRHYADMLKGSKYPNLKELRVKAQGKKYRIAFIFTGDRVCLLLSGDVSEIQYQAIGYQRLLSTGDFSNRRAYRHQTVYADKIPEANGFRCGNKGTPPAPPKRSSFGSHAFSYVKPADERWSDTVRRIPLRHRFEWFILNQYGRSP